MWSLYHGLVSCVQCERHESHVVRISSAVDCKKRSGHSRSFQCASVKLLVHLEGAWLMAWYGQEIASVENVEVV